MMGIADDQERINRLVTKFREESEEEVEKFIDHVRTARDNKRELYQKRKKADQEWKPTTGGKNSDIRRRRLTTNDTVSSLKM